MFTYLLLVLGFGAGLTALSWRWIPWRLGKALGITLLAVLTLSVVFDNIIVGLGIVGYSEDHILGLRTPIAPIEDYGYAVFGTFLVPAVWRLLARLGKDREHD
jgi:lycopene cyclase domain-containing protein